MNGLKRTLILLSCSLAVLLGCQPKRHSEKKQVLRLNMVASPATFDPRRGADLSTTCLHFFLFEGLTRLTDAGPAQLGIAQDIDISNDGLTYIFHLRNSHWSDGTPVSAYDFDYAWKSMLAPDFPCPNAHLLYSIKNAKAARQGFVSVDEVGVEVIDPWTLKVTLEAPTPYFLEIVSFATLHPVPKHLAEDNPNWSDAEDLVNNGPFKLYSHTARKDLKLKPNEEYWDRNHISLTKIKVSFIDDETTALHMYEQGELDLLGGYYTAIPDSAISSLKNSDDLRIYPVPGSTHLAFNTQQWPFDQPSIRKALAAAIDREEIVSNVTQLGEDPAYDLVHPALKNEVILPHHFMQDPKALLDDALKELGISLSNLPTITISYSKAGLSHKLAQTIQQQWTTTLGLKVKLSAAEHKVHLSRLMKHQYQVGIFNIWAQYQDPINVLERYALLNNPKNYMHWSNDDYTVCLTPQSSMARRTKLLAQAERILLNEMPIAPIFHWRHALLQKPHVKNVYISKSGGIYLHEAIIEVDEKVKQS